jgi:hypothetical protein
MLKDPETSFSIRKLLLLSSFYHYGVSLPINEKELDALTKILIQYENSPNMPINLRNINYTLRRLDQEQLLTGIDVIDNSVLISGHQSYINKILKWDVEKILEKKIEDINIQNVVNVTSKVSKRKIKGFKHLRYTLILKDIDHELNNFKKDVKKSKNGDDIRKLNSELKILYEKFQNRADDIYQDLISGVNPSEKVKRQNENTILKQFIQYETFQSQSKLIKQRDDIEKWMREEEIIWFDKLYLSERFLHDIVTIRDMKKLEKKYKFKEVNREEIESIIEQANNLVKRRRKASDELKREEKLAKEEKFKPAKVGGELLTLHKLMRKVKKRDEFLFQVAEMNSFNPIVNLSSWGDDVFDSYVRIVRNILDEPAEIDIYLKDFIDFIPILK